MPFILAVNNENMSSNQRAHSWQITDKEANQRLDIFVAHQLKKSRSAAVRIIKKTTVNHEKCKPSHTLKVGDIVEIVREKTPIKSQSQESNNAPIDQDLPPILYEDEHLLIIDKPRDLVVHAGAGVHEATLVDILRAHDIPLSNAGDKGRSGIVHRLDKGTSGAMVICKTNQAHEMLTKMFAERRIKKIYQAIVCGVPPQRGVIDAPIFRHPVKRQKMSVQATGRPARTEYKVLLSWRYFALMEIDIKTGRTHQIRVHFQYIHHPIVGDGTYGGRKMAAISAKNQNKDLEKMMRGIQNPMLHAAKLEFQHPVTKVLLSVESPLPQDMQSLVAALDGADGDSVVNYEK